MTQERIGYLSMENWTLTVMESLQSKANASNLKLLQITALSEWGWYSPEWGSNYPGVERHLPCA